MKLTEFLILLLQTQSFTLQKLAGILGEELLLELLEIAGDETQTPEWKGSPIESSWFEPPRAGNHRMPYAEIEGAVRELHLPATLEFHLWAYPYYRLIVESSISLNSIVSKNKDTVECLVAHALEHANHWIKALPIEPEHSRQIEQAALAPWLKFRSQVFRKLGNNHLSAV